MRRPGWLLSGSPPVSRAAKEAWRGDRGRTDNLYSLAAGSPPVSSDVATTSTTPMKASQRGSTVRESQPASLLL